MTFDDRDVTPVHGEREILERVRARGTALRRRKVFARAASAMVVVVLLAGGIAVAYQGGGQKPTSGGFVNSAAPTESASPSDVPTDTPIEVPAVTETLTEQPSPGASARVYPLRVPCINSTDPACGEFYWDPTPGPNAPMTVTANVSSKTLTVGETVTVNATAVDPDAPIACHYIDWGPTYIGTAIAITPRYGRWETPEKKRGEEAPTFTHKYQTAGTYRIDFYSVSGASCLDSGASPYSSGGQASVTVTVVDATPSPSVSPAPSASESPSPSTSP